MLEILPFDVVFKQKYYQNAANFSIRLENIKRSDVVQTTMLTLQEQPPKSRFAHCLELCTKHNKCRHFMMKTKTALQKVEC